jgi:hypothetical protein
LARVASNFVRSKHVSSRDNTISKAECSYIGTS